MYYKARPEDARETLKINYISQRSAETCYHVRRAQEADVALPGRRLLTGRISLPGRADLHGRSCTWTWVLPESKERTVQEIRVLSVWLSVVWCLSLRKRLNEFAVNPCVPIVFRWGAKIQCNVKRLPEGNCNAAIAAAARLRQ